MSYIKVNLEGLNSLREQIEISKKKLGSIISDVEGVKSGLDWDVAAEEKINARLINAISEIEDNIKNISKMSNFLNDAFEWYRKVEEDNCKLSETYMAAMRAKGEATLKKAKELELENARKGAVSLDDGVAQYLAGIKDENGFVIKTAGIAFNSASFDATGTAKLLIPGSEIVNDAKKKAIQSAYASIIGAEQPSYSETEFAESITGVVFDTSDQITGLMGKGDVASAALGKLVETGFDLAKYSEWNSEQKKIFYQSINSADENLRLLNELKTIYSNDKVLVEYCNESIEDINKFLSGENIEKIVGSRDYANAKIGENIISENVFEGAMDYFVPKVIELGINKMVQGGGAIVTGTGAFAGYVAEYTLGTGTTAETYDSIDIFYNDIESSVNIYNEAMVNGNLSEAAQKFSELSILNQKMEALEISKSLLNTMGTENETLVKEADGMIESLQREYDIIANNGQ